jgi:hypothetical protein
MARLPLNSTFNIQHSTFPVALIGHRADRLTRELLRRTLALLAVMMIVSS